MQEPVLVEELRRRRLARLGVAAQPRSALEEEETEEARRSARFAATHGAAVASWLREPVGESAETQRSPEEEPSCRICHGEGGLLFSPCLCRGTTRFVHPACLASWRVVSESQQSFHTCDVCGHRYEVKRAAWAPYLENRRVQRGLAALLTAAAVAVSGALCRVLHLDVAGLFYRAVYWLPSWHNPFAVRWLPPALRAEMYRRAGLLDATVCGSVLVGLSGAGWAAFRTYQHDNAWFIRHALPSIALAFFNSGTPALRLFVAGGLVFGWACVRWQHRVQCSLRTAGVQRSRCIPKPSSSSRALVNASWR